MSVPLHLVTRFPGAMVSSSTFGNVLHPWKFPEKEDRSSAAEGWARA